MLIAVAIGTGERCVGRRHPDAGNCLVAAGDGIERAEGANQKRSEFEGFRPSLKRGLASLQARHGRFGYADDFGKLAT